MNNNNNETQTSMIIAMLLGYKVGEDEISSLPEKVLTVKTIIAPTFKRWLGQFAGGAAFHNCFIKTINKTAASLYNLLRKERFIRVRKW